MLVAPSVTERGRRLLAEHGLEFVALEPPRADENAGATDGESEGEGENESED